MSLCDEAFFTDVIDEYNMATAKFGAFNSAHEGYAVLLEETDELWDVVKANPHKAPGALVNDPERNLRVHRERMREEAIQVAAMALRFLKDVTQ